jgi:hypothetical protein
MGEPIHLDTAGWDSVDPGDWTNDRGERMVLQRSDVVPDLPAVPEDVVAMREGWPRSHGGNLGIDFVLIDGLPAVSVMTKFLAEGSGLVILGSLIIPRADRSFAIRVQCAEGSPTGARESAVMLILMGEGHEFPPADGRMQGWQVGQDLDPPLKQRNLADDERWDALLPDHCISRCRAHLRHIVETTRIDDAFRRIAPFDRN